MTEQSIMQIEAVQSFSPDVSDEALESAMDAMEAHGFPTSSLACFPGPR